MAWMTPGFHNKQRDLDDMHWPGCCGSCRPAYRLNIRIVRPGVENNGVCPTCEGASRSNRPFRSAFQNIGGWASLVHPDVRFGDHQAMRGERRRGMAMGDEHRVKREAMQILGRFRVLPRLVVFDLDYTLWPFLCHLHRETPSLYRDVKGILLALKDTGIDVAIASRSPTADIANTFLEHFGIRTMFVAKEIFASRTYKTEHFQRINRRTGVPFNSMLFFDDEDRNIQAVSKMGVTGMEVMDGLSLGAFRQGLAKFNQNSCSAWRRN